MNMPAPRVAQESAERMTGQSGGAVEEMQWETAGAQVRRKGIGFRLGGIYLKY